MTWMVQDVMRTMDYLTSRPDIDADRIAYMGLSYGAEFAVPLALEKRFRTAVLVGAGLDPSWWGATPEEVAPWNYVSRISVPTLVVNGRHDFMHPYEEAQVPFFEMLGVRDEDKTFVVLDAGHLPPNNDVIRLALRWLDERLGRVGAVP